LVFGQTDAFYSTRTEKSTLTAAIAAAVVVVAAAESSFAVGVGLALAGTEQLVAVRAEPPVVEPLVVGLGLEIAWKQLHGDYPGSMRFEAGIVGFAGVLHDHHFLHPTQEVVDQQSLISLYLMSFENETDLKRMQGQWRFGEAKERD
jgi:hypothetical protein